ncbi:MAG: ASKHA domain-containing protein, partial [Candidatus Aminicenantes bacterium]|nr:ASKHA domain-containing protein [Candidatus Aminicenantes bacterium]
MSVRFLPFEIEATVEEGASLLDTIRQINLPIKTSCGGEGTCGECCVRISRGTVSENTVKGLPTDIVSQGFVLACQTKIEDNLFVQLPHFDERVIQSVTESDYFNENKDNISGVYEVNPAVRKISLKLDPPSLENNYSDLRRLKNKLDDKLAPNEWTCEISVLQKLAQSVRQDPDRVDCILFSSGLENTILDVVPTSLAKKVLGIACDIGTSTVALHLVDLTDGHILSTASSFNQQIKCGDDIISRINYARKPERQRELHKLLIKTINHLIHKAAESAGVSYSDIYYGSFSGNTTMIHLLLNLDPRYIREDPYVPTFNLVPIFPAEKLGLDMQSEARIFCAPSVGSYVGGDITAGILSTPMLRNAEDISLLIDAGTNGELVIGNKDWMMTCACSTGPAFEGSGIQCGMPASEGAIESVKLNREHKLDFRTINKSRPRGLCGSGLVDLLAELFINGFIDRSGKFISETTKGRLKDTEKGPAFLILHGKDTFWGHDLVITEKEIASLIRTKGAIFSACQLLIKNIGIDFNNINNVYIAGGFGRHLNIENAIRIGLLPDLDRNKFHYVGNSSLLGSLLVLLSDKNRETIENLVDKITYLELNTEPRYMNEYTGALFLPHTEIELFPSVKILL